MTYTKPPKELFSRMWFGPNDGAEPWKQRNARINKTKKKLEDLELKLRIKLHWNPFPSHLHPPKEVQSNDGKFFIDTISLLNSYIGVWESTKFLTPSNLPYSILPYSIKMLYPDTNRVIQTWDELVLGGVKREGVCLTMLSPECVEWLNWVSDWANE